MDYSRKENQAAEIINLNYKIRRNTRPHTQTAPGYSSANVIMLVIFWTVRDFCIIFDCRNSFISKLLNLWTANNLFNPENTQSSSEESLKKKRQASIGISSLFTWFNMQILNLCHRWYRRIHNAPKYLKWSVLRK